MQFLWIAIFCFSIEASYWRSCIDGNWISWCFPSYCFSINPIKFSIFQAVIFSLSYLLERVHPFRCLGYFSWNPGFFFYCAITRGQNCHHNFYINRYHLNLSFNYSIICILKVSLYSVLKFRKKKNSMDWPLNFLNTHIPRAASIR